MDTACRDKAESPEKFASLPRFFLRLVVEAPRGCRKLGVPFPESEFTFIILHMLGHNRSSATRVVIESNSHLASMGMMIVIVAC